MLYSAQHGCGGVFLQLVETAPAYLEKLARRSHRVALVGAPKAIKTAPRIFIPRVPGSGTSTQVPKL